MRVIDSIQADITNAISGFKVVAEAEAAAHAATQAAAKVLEDLRIEYFDAKSALGSFEDTVNADFEKIKAWL